MKRYPAYKASGVEWLREVPKHWSVQRLKWLIDRNDGGVWGEDADGEGGTVVLRSTEQTAAGQWKLDEPARRKLTDAERASATLEVGDLLVTKSSGSALHIGKTTLVDDQVAALGCCYSNFMQRIRVSSGLLPKLAWYVMNSELARRQLDLASNTTTGLANLNGTMIADFVLLLPSEIEQAEMVAFLDRETAKIDALIAEQEKLIALLAEKRQATISHAVTRGLDPTVPLKQSGVAWVGAVPSHWQVRRLKHLVREGIAGPYGSSLTKSMYTASGYRVYGQQQVIPDDFTVGNYYIPEGMFADMQRYQVRPNDVLISVMGTIGRAAVVPGDAEPGIINPRLVLYRVDDALILPRYLQAFLNCPASQEYFALAAQGTTMEGLNMSSIGELYVAVPPLGEQQALLKHIAQVRSKLGELSGNATRAIDLLRERRSALITAAVTGQIDVRGAVQSEPKSAEGARA